MQCAAKLHTMRFFRCLTSSLLLLFCASPAIAQDAPASAQVEIRLKAALSPGVASFPLVVAGPGVTAPIAAKINAALTSLDVKVATAASDCRQDFREQQPEKSSRDAWQREVDVTMRGPRFLSLLARDSYYCGGMYPNDGLLLPLVYDLKSGRPVDWLTLLPTGVSAVLDTAADGSRVGVVVWPWLRHRAISEADGECKSAFADSAEVTFGLWLDAKKDALMAQPLNLPHVEAACAHTISIPVDEASRIGLAKELMESLRTAHAGMASGK